MELSKEISTTLKLDKTMFSSSPPPNTHIIDVCNEEQTPPRRHRLFSRDVDVDSILRENIPTDTTTNMDIHPVSVSEEAEIKENTVWCWRQNPPNCIPVN